MRSSRAISSPELAERKDVPSRAGENVAHRPRMPAAPLTAREASHEAHAFCCGTAHRWRRSLFRLRQTLYSRHRQCVTNTAPGSHQRFSLLIATSAALSSNRGRAQHSRITDAVALERWRSNSAPPPHPWCSVRARAPHHAAPQAEHSAWTPSVEPRRRRRTLRPSNFDVRDVVSSNLEARWR